MTILHQYNVKDRKATRCYKSMGNVSFVSCEIDSIWKSGGLYVEGRLESYSHNTGPSFLIPRGNMCENRSFS